MRTLEQSTISLPDCTSLYKITVDKGQAIMMDIVFAKREEEIDFISKKWPINFTRSITTVVKILSSSRIRTICCTAHVPVIIFGVKVKPYEYRTSLTVGRFGCTLIQLYSILRDLRF